MQRKRNSIIAYVPIVIFAITYLVGWKYIARIALTCSFSILLIRTVKYFIQRELYRRQRRYKDVGWDCVDVRNFIFGIVSCRNKWFCKTNNSNCFRIIPFTQFVVPTWNIISNVLVERRKMRVDVLSAVAALLFLTILYYIEDDTKPIIGFIMVAFVLYHVCCPQGIFYQYFKLRF